jgi:hypothetical protein
VDSLLNFVKLSFVKLDLLLSRLSRTTLLWSLPVVVTCVLNERELLCKAHWHAMRIVCALLKGYVHIARFSRTAVCTV